MRTRAGAGAGAGAGSDAESAGAESTGGAGTLSRTPNSRRARHGDAFMGGRLTTHKRATSTDSEDPARSRLLYRQSSVSHTGASLGRKLGFGDAAMATPSPSRRKRGGVYAQQHHTRMHTDVPGHGTVWVGSWNMGAVDPFEGCEPEVSAQVSLIFLFSRFFCVHALCCLSIVVLFSLFFPLLSPSPLLFLLVCPRGG